MGKKARDKRKLKMKRRKEKKYVRSFKGNEGRGRMETDNC